VGTGDIHRVRREKRGHDRRQLAETGTFTGWTTVIALVGLTAGTVILHLHAGLLTAMLLMLCMIMKQARMTGSHWRDCQ